jgi:murein DD-endopeptidase MepM/ murein hydrolase activator NlpD
MSYIKVGIFSALVLIGLVVGWRFYGNYGGATVPHIEVTGIRPNQGLSGDVSIVVKGSDASKIASVTVLIDEKPLVKELELSKKTFSYPLTLSSKELSQGHHVLRVVVENDAHEKKITRLEVPFYSDNLPLQASLTKNESDARIYQGRTLHVAFQANKEIKDAHMKTLSQSYPCYLQSNRGFIYECFVPIDCEEIPQEYPYSIEVTDWAGTTLHLDGTFHVVAFPFKKQTIRVDKEKIKEENEIGLPEKQLETAIEELTKKSPHKKLWSGRFIVPLELTDNKQITSDFGVIRATQERGLSQHKALDLVAFPKAVVWAPQDGIVVIKERYAHSGNTIAIDHGYGLMSLFFHLDQFAPVNVGDPVKKGNPVGTVGKTGYATGYHLHWEMRVNTVPVDPLEWTTPNF